MEVGPSEMVAGVARKLGVALGLSLEASLAANSRISSVYVGEGYKDKIGGRGFSPTPTMVTVP